MGRQKSWQIWKVLKRFCRKLNYEAMLKNLFCNTSLEFLKATFRRWNLIFPLKRILDSHLSTFFAENFSFRKPCPFKKVISIKGLFLHSLIDCGFDFTLRWNPTCLIQDLQKQIHSSKRNRYSWKQNVLYVLEMKLCLLGWYSAQFWFNFGCFRQAKFWSSEHFDQMQLLVQKKSWNPKLKIQFGCADNQSFDCWGTLTKCNCWSKKKYKNTKSKNPI